MKNKSVLVTGSAKRIGKAIAMHMASIGWNVAVHYNSSDSEAEALVDTIKKMGVNAVSIKADLGDEKQAKGVIEQAADGIGEITCLINNASVFENDKLSNLTAEKWHKHMEINLHAPLVLSQEFVKQLGANSKGNIINMLDYCVWNLPDKFLSYAVSKSGLWAVTQILAKQLAPNVRVNGIGPGHSLPNIRESQESFEKAYKQTPLQVQTEPEEICRAIEFIIGSPSMTGQMIALDGGKHLLGAEFY
jgi:NAD(P)-dependent dehydrogenase (short-subunit alcohol dehydrogenase family)